MPRRPDRSPPLSPALPRALAALERGAQEERVAACAALGVPDAPAPVVEALLRALDDAATPVRAAAATALGAVGAAAAGAACRPLLRLLRGGPTSPDAVRCAASAALTRLAPRGAEAARVLARALTDERREVRLHAAVALRAMPLEDVLEALPALAGLLGHRSDDVSDEVVRTLVHVGRARPEAVAAAVLTALRPRRPRARATGARVLADVGRLDATWTREAFEWLAHRDDWVRTCAAIVVGRLDVDPAERARRAVAALRAAGPGALPHLLALWDALGLGSHAADAVRALARARAPAARLTAVGCCARLAPADAAPLLAALAGEDPGAGVRLAALEGLGRPDLPADAAHPPLLEALRRPATCDAAARALCRRLAAARAEAPSVTGPVLAALRASDARVRAAAGRCLAALQAGAG